MALIFSGMEDTLLQACTLQGHCYIVSGLTKNLSYDGWVNPTNMGIKPPPVKATDEGTNLAGSLVVGGVYKCQFEYYNINKDQPSGFSPASSDITCQSNGGIRVNIPADANVDSQVTHIRAYLTTDAGSVYRLDGSKAYTGSAITYDFTAVEGSRETVMGKLDSAGTANIDVHGVPPTCPYVLTAKNRIFLFGSKTFSGGTAAVTNGSKTVTITSDTLPTGIEEEMYFKVDGSDREYIIATRTDDTNLELTEDFDESTDSGLTYYIYGKNSILYYTYIDPNGNSYPESFPSDHWLPIEQGDNNEGSGLGFAHNQVIIFKTRAMGILSGSSKDDFLFTHISREIGCISAYTIDKNDKGDCIFLSESGVCVTNGVEVYNLCEGTIKNIFTGEGDPPWKVERTRLANAVGRYDPSTNHYRIWLSSDGETTNNKYLDYDFNKVDGISIGWTDGDGIVGHQCGIIEDSDGNERLAFGCDGGVSNDAGFVYYYDEDVENDGAGATSTNRGTATATSANTITDSTATFTDDIIGCNCSILSGTNSGDIKRISARNSATQFTVEANFAATPDTTSVYAIGAIDCSRTSKWFDFGVSGRKTIEKIKLIFKQATHTLFVKLFKNFSSTATINKTVDLDNSKCFKEIKLGVNKGRYWQMKVGLNDVDKRIEVKEIGLDVEGRGKPENLQ